MQVMVKESEAQIQSLKAGLANLEQQNKGLVEEVQLYKGRI